MTESKKPVCQLYLITPPKIDLLTFREKLASALDSKNIVAVQLRLKDATDDQIKRAADLLFPIIKASGANFIINDRPDLAEAIGCDGVHIGQEDTKYEIARTIIGEKRIIGVTCHNSRHLAMIAGEQGADYIAFGAFFPTKTKKTKYRADIKILEWWSELMLTPAVAIGGINIENCPPLVRAGADFLAVSSAIWNCSKGPSAAVSRFNKVIADNAP